MRRRPKQLPAPLRACRLRVPRSSRHWPSERRALGRRAPATARRSSRKHPGGPRRAHNRRENG
eukprot:37202-Alexandrium_andersonii.AAC.1